MVDITNLDQGIYWSGIIVFYFFFKGIASGIFGIISFGELNNNKKLKKITGPALWISFAFTYALPFLLIADLDQPFRFWRIFAFGSLTSPMSYGAWVLLLYMLFGGITTHLYFRRNFVLKYNELNEKGSKFAILFKLISFNRLNLSEEERVRDKKFLKLAFYIDIFIAFSLELYAATLISVVNSRPLWESPMITLIFITSAFVSGAAALILIFGLVAYFSEKVPLDMEVIYMLGRIIFIGLVIELIFSVFQMIYLKNSTLLNAQFFGTPELAANYALVHFGLIIILPLILFAFPQIRKNLLASTLSSLLVIYTSFLSKYLLIIDGQEVSRTGGGLLELEFTGRELTILISISLGLISAILFVYWYVPWQYIPRKGVATK